jgi:hypothetical protein
MDHDIKPRFRYCGNEVFYFGLNSEADGQRSRYLQFNFSGEVTDSCYFIIEN